MSFLLVLFILFSHNPMIREMACVSEIRCKDGMCATKWVCPYGIVYVAPKD